MKSKPVTREDTLYMAAHNAAMHSTPSGVRDAIAILLANGQTDGEHHKQWVIDQALRALAGTNYARVIQLHNDGEDGPDSYAWNVGVAP